MEPFEIEVRMIDDMGIFRTSIEVAHVARPAHRITLANAMVDTGSEYNWIPRALLESLGVEPEREERFETADGSVITRQVGFALVYAGGRGTATVVVFAGASDKTLLGAVGLEGMNLRVDLVRRELVPAGPVPVAASSLPSQYEIAKRQLSWASSAISVA